MNNQNELFEAWYCEQGFPELPNADFGSIKAAFIQGWAYGRAEAKHEVPPAPAPAPLPPRSRYRIGKVSAEDTRPITDAQMRFVRKLISDRIRTDWATDFVFTIYKTHVDMLQPIITTLCEGQTYSIRMLTMGQASQVIDLLKNKRT